MVFRIIIFFGIVLYNEALHEICKLPASTGPCENWEDRWTYNILLDQCEKFLYGGCEGNKNNFASAQQCQAVCRKVISSSSLQSQSKKKACFQSMDSGNCYASILRFYYNTENGNCEKFTYGGCGGNSNNFLTENECERKCRAPKGVENEMEQRTKATDDTIFDENKSVDYRTLKIDPLGKVCPLFAETGPCDRRIRRYFYNSLTKKCTQFVFGGCGGNKNNFMTLNECRKACAKSMATYSSVKGFSLATCRLLPESGPCKKFVTKFYFNAITRQCDTFEYGGCRGNKNKFDILQDCRNTCEAMNNKLEELTSINICKEEPVFQYDIILSCYKLSVAYSYNETSNSCEKFFYSGCGGNKNRFRNKQLCVDTCVRKDI